MLDMTIKIFISVVCGSISVALVLALIFSSKFRDAVLGGEGEATIIGLITVKGVAIVLLCALFLAGMLYPLYISDSACKGPIIKIETLVNEKFVYEVENAADRSDRSTLKDMIKRIQAAIEEAKQCY